MTVETILKAKGNEVVTVPPSANVETAASIMKQRTIGALVVLEEGAVVGICFERDIVAAIGDHGEKAAHMEVSEVMTRNVVSCTSKDSLKKVMQMMTQYRTRHLPCIDGGKLTGLVSIGDIVKNRVEELELESGVLRDAYIARG
jgi:CBS domain-containing protein